MKYPIGIQTFEKIRREGFLYIDKTRSLYDLLAMGQCYFLSRPRRFGKSLFVSTIRAYFEGKKELFEGLYIAEKEKEWNPYPVLHIAMSDLGVRSERLVPALKGMLDNLAYEHRLELRQEEIGARFKELIIKLAERGRVVVLIDEYDKALTTFMDEPETFEENRRILKSFYGVLKDADSYLHFLFVTGVSRFSKISLFSDMNNLTDISMKSRYATICGYTEEDMRVYFGRRISELAAERGISENKMFELVRLKYNGYNFNGKQRIYNPWSVLNCMAYGELKNYWFETGTPYFLKTYAERFVTDVEGVITSQTQLGHLDFWDEDLTPLLYQTGYLTLDEELEEGLFRLRHPNEEVSESFRRLLLVAYTQKGDGELQYAERFIREGLKEKDAEKLKSALNACFANIPYQIFIRDKEAYYHSILHLVFMLLHYRLRSEVSVSGGRIDLVLEKFGEVWLLECKLDESAQAALDQIQNKDYPAAYRNTGKSLWAMGINFDSKTKRIEELKILQIS